MQDPVLQVNVAGHCADVVHAAQVPFKHKLVGHWKLLLQGISVQTPVIQTPSAHSSCHVQAGREEVEAAKPLETLPEISPPVSPAI
jgi:hypothetical protein